MAKIRNYETELTKEGNLTIYLNDRTTMLEFLSEDLVRIVKGDKAVVINEVNSCLLVNVNSLDD